MRIGLVGCGYAADVYASSLRKYRDVEIAAATDLDRARASQFGSYHSISVYPTLEELLADRNIKIIVNLTNPKSHFAVSKACLEAGKHVYTEKPMAMTFPEAQALVEVASRNGVCLSSAPCGLLGETAQTLWRAVRSGDIGKVRLVYAELDDGPTQLREPHLWRSPSGAPHDYRDEFEVGCTLEHAAYYLTWFTAFFGPARAVTSFAACVWPDRAVVPGQPLHVTTPDVSVACITFASGVAARLTCSIVAPHNHALQVIGDEGVLTIDDCWNYSAPVYRDKYSKRRLQAARFPITRTYPFLKTWLGPHPRAYPAVKKVGWKKRHARYRQDFARGVADLARAVGDGRPPRLPADYCLHVNELVLAIQNPTTAPHPLQTTFEPLRPMDDREVKEFAWKEW